MHGELRSTRLARQAESFMMCMSLPVVLACYLDSGETRIIKIRIATKNTENFKNRNVLYTQFLALRYQVPRDPQGLGTGLVSRVCMAGIVSIVCFSSHHNIQNYMCKVYNSILVL